MSLKKKLKFLTATALFFVLVWYLRKAPEVLLEEVVTESFQEKIIQIEVEGQVQPVSSEYLVVRQGGSLDELKFGLGDTVNAGQVIAVVDAGRHEARLRRALSQYKLAEADFNRSSQLFRSRTETKQDFDRAQNALTIARADVEEAKKNLEDSIVRAPFQGVLTHLSFKKGDNVPSGSRVAAIEDFSRMVVRARMPKHTRSFFPYAGPLELRTPEGQKMNFTNIKLDMATAEGFFEEDFDVEWQIDTSMGLDAKKGKVVLKMDLTKLENVVQVPLSALDSSEEKTRVLVLTPQDRLEWQDVSVVLTFGPSAYIAKDSTNGRIVQMIRSKELNKYLGQKIKPKITPLSASGKKNDISL